MAAGVRLSSAVRCPMILAATFAVAACSSVSALSSLSPSGGRVHRHAEAAPRDVSPSAAVFAESLRGPGRNETAAELLRFVTAYRAGIEAIVDVTPFTPLLKASASADGDLNFYAFIDTWVNSNSAPSTILYMDNVTGKCYPKQHFDGNGWALTLDLVLWPGRGVDTRPRSSVTLGTGYFGGRYDLGVVAVHAGNLSGDGDAVFVDLDKPADLRDSAAPPRVYACDEGGPEASRAALLGYAARSAEMIHGGPGNREEKADDLEDVKSELLMSLIYPNLLQVNVSKTFDHNLSVSAAYDPARMVPREGMPVYLRGVSTDQLLYKRRQIWWNLSYPFEPAGEVSAVFNGTMILSLKHPCLPAGNDTTLPRLLVPVGPAVVPEATALADVAMQHGRQKADASSVRSPLGQRSALQGRTPEPLMLAPTPGGWARWKSAIDVHAGAEGSGLENGHSSEVSLADLEFLGRIDVESGSSGDGPSLQLLGTDGRAAATAAGRRVCVVQQHTQGQVFRRRFRVPALSAGERAVMQLAVTGHGWSDTSQHCGEYCHAVYRIAMNGASAFNATQFRKDCKDNPVNGAVQHGTWFESRNGWCPGAVEPGLFVDVTSSVQPGENDLDFNVVVWNNYTQSYEEYTDFAGFALGDVASLTVGMSLFVYGSEAVSAIRAQDRAFTAAEAALRDGSSHPAALRPPAVVEWDDWQDVLSLWQGRHSRFTAGGQRQDTVPSTQRGGNPSPSVLQQQQQQQQVHAHDPGTAEPRTTSSAGDGFEFEGRAPWYIYNASAEGPPGAGAGAYSVRIFDGALVQGSSRTVRASIKESLVSADFSRAALHLRLSKPPGLEYDAWDRQASLGLLLREGGQRAEVFHLPPPAAGSGRWPVAPAAGDGLAEPVPLQGSA